MANKGKEWRRKAMAAGERKAATDKIFDEDTGREIRAVVGHGSKKVQLPTYDPTTTNKQRMEQRRARRAYLQEKMEVGKL